MVQPGFCRKWGEPSPKSLSLHFSVFSVSFWLSFLSNHKGTETQRGALSGKAANDTSERSMIVHL